MTIDHFTQALEAFRTRLPFKPFAVILGSGKQFEVDHPGALAHRDGGAVFFEPGGAPHIFDHEGVGHFVGDLADRPAG